MFVDITCISKDLWNATPEALTCIRERGNRNDVFAVPRSGIAKLWQYCWAYTYKQISGRVFVQAFGSVCMLFICRGGVLNCLITGSRRYSRDLPQGASYQEVCIYGA